MLYDPRPRARPGWPYRSPLPPSSPGAAVVFQGHSSLITTLCSQELLFCVPVVSAGIFVHLSLSLSVYLFCLYFCFLCPPLTLHHSLPVCFMSLLDILLSMFLSFPLLVNLCPLMHQSLPPFNNVIISLSTNFYLLLSPWLSLESLSTCIPFFPLYPSS